MKIIILTQYYPPEIGAPQRRLSELAERMIRAGHQVTVLTAMPNYPVGKIHPGYGGVYRRERISGIELIRAFIFPTQKASIFFRLLNYFSFVLSSMVIGSWTLRRADYLLVESPPLFLGFSALWLSWIKRARLIFNVSDLWPESAVRLGIVREGSISHRLSSWLERFFYKSAWLVSGQSRSILSDIQARFPDKSTFLLSNGVDTTKFAHQVLEKNVRLKLSSDADQCVVLYAGLHGLAQGLSQVLDVAERLISASRIRFVLVGDGPEKAQLVSEARKRGLDSVLFLDPVSADQVPAMLMAADVLLVTLKEFIPGAVPSKLYESMASGKPILLVANGEPADIVKQHHVGLVVEPQDIGSFAQAVTVLAADQNLRDQLGNNGRKTAEEHFNRDKIAAQFIQHLEKTVR